MSDQREAFLQLANDCHLDRDTEDTAWIFWQAAIAHAVPPGHVVVPVEPTEAMRLAGMTELPLDAVQFTARVYSAMIAAMPSEKVEPNRHQNEEPK